MLTNEETQKIENITARLVFEAMLMRSVLETIFKMVDDANGQVPVEMAAKIAAMAQSASNDDTVSGLAFLQNKIGVEMKASIVKAVDSACAKADETIEEKLAARTKRH